MDTPAHERYAKYPPDHPNSTAIIIVAVSGPHPRAIAEVWGHASGSIRRKFGRMSIDHAPHNGASRNTRLDLDSGRSHPSTHGSGDSLACQSGWSERRHIVKTITSTAMKSILPAGSLPPSNSQRKIAPNRIGSSKIAAPKTIADITFIPPGIPNNLILKSHKPIEAIPHKSDIKSNPIQPRRKLSGV